MASEREELIRVVVQEISDRLATLDGLLLDIEENPGERELLDQFMRAAHTLKGTAGIAGLSATSNLAHALEGVVERIRDGHLRASAEVFDRLSHVLEVITRALPSIGRGEPEPDDITTTGQALDTWLDEVGARRADPNATTADAGFVLGEYDLLRIRVLQRKGNGLFRVHIPLPSGTEEPVGWATTVLRVLGQLGTVIATDPRGAELGELPRRHRLLALLGSQLSLDALSEQATELGLSNATVAAHEAAAAVETDTAAAKLPQRIVSERTVRVELEVLDELLRLVGELMISRDRYRQVATDFTDGLDDPALGSEISDAAAQLGHLSSDLQDAIMRARMVSVSRVFRSLKREVRRAARDADCTIPFVMTGERTELDKNLVDRLTVPLASFTHHLAYAQLQHAGAQQLEIRVQAERRWNQVVISLEAERTEIQSDAVRELMKELAPCGGRIETKRSRRGDVSYVIALPLTLAIIQAMMARVGEEVYAFPIEAVRETIQLDTSEVAQIRGTQVADLRGRALSLLFLGEFFAVPNAQQRAGTRILVLGQDEAPIGVIVDEIIGIREVVIKPLSSRLAHIDAISGSAILGDDQIALILNADALVANAIRSAGRVIGAAVSSTPTLAVSP